MEMLPLADLNQAGEVVASLRLPPGHHAERDDPDFVPAPVLSLVVLFLGDIPPFATFDWPVVPP